MPPASPGLRRLWRNTSALTSMLLRSRPSSFVSTCSMCEVYLQASLRREACKLTATPRLMDCRLTGAS